MNGDDLREFRVSAEWSQELTATKLRVTQAYLSMVESGKRPVSKALATKALRVFQVPPSLLPLKKSWRFPRTAPHFEEELGRLGYPGYSYLRGQPRFNPAELLLAALDTDELDQRVTEALPWLPFNFPAMNWPWLISQAKLSDRQNRLAYVVFLAMDVAGKKNLQLLERDLRMKLQGLEHSRLALEDTLCKESMTQTERKWLRANRPKSAKHWNLLTDLTAEQLSHVYL